MFHYTFSCSSCINTDYKEDIQFWKWFLRRKAAIEYYSWRIHILHYSTLHWFDGSMHFVQVSKMVQFSKVFVTFVWMDIANFNCLLCFFKCNTRFGFIQISIVHLAGNIPRMHRVALSQLKWIRFLVSVFPCWIPLVICFL